MAYGDVLPAAIVPPLAVTVLPQTGASGISLMVMIAATMAGVMVASRVITRAVARHQAR